MISAATTLTQFFHEWQQALKQAQALHHDAVLKEARFKGAAELIHGPAATFVYTEKDGLRFKASGDGS